MLNNTKNKQRCRATRTPIRLMGPLGKELVSHKVEHTFTINLSNSTNRHSPKRNENKYPQKVLYGNVHSNFTCYSQNVETTRMSNNRWQDEQTVIQPTPWMNLKKLMKKLDTVSLHVHEILEKTNQIIEIADQWLPENGVRWELTKKEYEKHSGVTEMFYTHWDSRYVDVYICQNSLKCTLKNEYILLYINCTLKKLIFFFNRGEGNFQDVKTRW